VLKEGTNEGMGRAVQFQREEKMKAGDKKGFDSSTGRIRGLED